ncbi:unnamed protein product, partial [Tetraodon nigroviridis]
GGGVAGGAPVFGSEHRARASCDQTSEERRGAEGDLHQACSAQQPCCPDQLSENRRQDPGGAHAKTPEPRSVETDMPQRVCVCVCRSLVLIYKLPATRRRSMPSNRLRVQSSSWSKACQPRHGYSTHTRVCVF